MDPYQNQGYGGNQGWTGGAWNPAQHGYNPNNNWPPQPPQPPQQLLPPPPQYNTQVASSLFCCENCQRVAAPTQPSVHAYTTRLAFFTAHILHPTVASYTQVPNRNQHPNCFASDVPQSQTIAPTGGHGGHGGHGQGTNAQQIAQQVIQQQGGQQQHGFMQQAPTGPAAGAGTHYTAVTGSSHQSGFNQQGNYQAGGGYAQNNAAQQHPRPNGPPSNTSMAIIGPIMHAGSSYSIDPNTAIPLPRFPRPTFQLNVKFRLERFRPDPPQQPFQYGMPNYQGFNAYQYPSYINPYPNTAVSPSTGGPKSRDNMELIWYYWPVQLEVPLWARGQNTLTSAPDIGAQLIREGMQIINGERWGFIQHQENPEGLWHKRRSYKILECPVHGMYWKVTVFVRRGY
ncbi:hypothetical protein BofuT4_P092380.1 [Botrytis cinerea T4]|uniref:Uncharacterized protein n=1 Tax=Botryotinia fuckeliana (strain T4) TaxID=999810 RepID=G2YET1_BOTF4|nr:hypothetical protein BofuT4_P092380.1 [Botrytis cinerea T4]